MRASHQLEELYHAREAANAGYGADSIEKITARRAEITEAERIARDSANSQNAAEAAKRQAEAEKLRAEQRAKLPAYLVAAKRLADASQGGECLLIGMLLACNPLDQVQDQIFDSF